MQRPLQYIYQGNALQIMNRMLFNKKETILLTTSMTTSSLETVGVRP